MSAGQTIYPAFVAYDIPGHGLPFADLNGSHSNYHAHQSRMQHWQDYAIVAIRQAGAVRIDPPVHITAWVHRTTNVKSDAHNVTPTAKAATDALVKAGIIPDDHDGIVEAFTIRRGVNWDQPGITLTVEGAL